MAATVAETKSLSELEAELNEANDNMAYFRRQTQIRTAPAGIANAARLAACWQITVRELLDRVKAAKALTQS